LMTEAHRYLALACLGQRSYAEAVKAGLISLGLARGGPLKVQIGLAWRVLGKILAELDTQKEIIPVVVDGKNCNAYDCFSASLQMFAEMGIPDEQARTARELARFERLHGDWREGFRLWQEARDLFAHLGMGIEVSRMDRLGETEKYTNNRDLFRTTNLKE
jgi:hypothetical protein